MKHKDQLTIRMLRSLALLVLMMLAPQGLWAEDHNIVVGGVRVTSDNASGVTGANITGTVSYDAQSNTLTLNDASIDMSNTDGYPVSSSIANLKVKLMGDNTFTLFTDKPYAFKFTNEANTGMLTFETEWPEDDPDNNSLGALTINDATEQSAVANGYNISNTKVSQVMAHLHNLT